MYRADHPSRLTAVIAVAACPPGRIVRSRHWALRARERVLRHNRQQVRRVEPEPDGIEQLNPSRAQLNGKPHEPMLPDAQSTLIFAFCLHIVALSGRYPGGPEARALSAAEGG